MSSLIQVSGHLSVGGIQVHNQVTLEGAKAVLTGLSAVSSTRVTNLMLLNSFAMPEGKVAKDLTFADVKNYIAPGAFVGANTTINPDGSKDMRVYISTDSVAEMTTIGTIPADKGNDNPTFNAAILVMNGDINQSASKNTVGYTPTGSEKLFAIAQFEAQTKDTINPYVLMWYTIIE
jgi:hypothetical protein